MRPAELRYRVTLQQPDLTPDAMGGEPADPLWLDVVTVWAAIEQRYQPHEGYVAPAAQRLAAAPYVLRLRRRAGITPAMRVQWGERILAIEAVLDEGPSAEEMRLHCREVY